MTAAGAAASSSLVPLINGNVGGSVMTSTGFFGAVRDAFAEKLSRRILVIALFVILIDVSSYFGFGGMFRGDDEARFGLIVLIAFILAFLVLLPICCAVLVRAVHNINSCQNDFIGQLKHSLVAFPYLLLMAGLSYYMWNFYRIARVTGWLVEFSYWL